MESVKACYLTPNPVNPALLARAANRIKQAGKGETTSDSNIVARRWLLIDCDPKRPSGISATEGEHDAALARCEAIRDHLHFNCGWPEPIVADSSNGGHLMYRVDLPTDDGGLIQRCLAALDAAFSDDIVCVDTGVFNPARIWKCYGTRSCKGDNTADRPHRMSRIISAPSTLHPVSREWLEALASEAPATESHHAANGHRSPNVVNGAVSFDIDAFIVEHGLQVTEPTAYQGGRRWEFEQSPLCDHHDRSAFLIQFPSGALSAKCHHDSCNWEWRDLREKFAPKVDDGLYERLLQNAAKGKAQPAGSPLGGQQFALPRITSAELDSTHYELSYIVDRTLVAGQPALLAGGHKTLKTSIAIDLAVSIASKGCFLGQLPAHRTCRVGVLSAESGMATVQETARRICSAAGVRLADLSVIWSPKLPRFDEPSHLAELTRWLTADGIEVAVFDPTYLAMPGKDSGNLFTQGERLRMLSETCQQTGTTPILCHHNKQTVIDAYAPPELVDVAWSGFAEFARQWLLVGRREKYEPGSGFHRLWLNIGGSAGHSALWGVDIDEGPSDGITPRNGRSRSSTPTKHANRRRSAKTKRDIRQPRRERPNNASRTGTLFAKR